MKSTPAKQKKPRKISRKNSRLDAMDAMILEALREARKEAIKIARMHGVPIIYMKNGKLIRERV